MDFLHLIRAVKQSINPGDFWKSQCLLLDNLKREESLIHKRRSRLEAIKKAKLNYTRSPGKSIDQIRRYDHLIEVFQKSEDHHWDNRNALRYLGDTLAYKLLPEHAVRAFSWGSDSGLVFDKDGLNLEIQCAEAIASAGHFALMNDLTHCLTVADLSVLGPNGLSLMECKSPGSNKRSDRHVRQLERAHYISDLLKNDKLELPIEKRDELALEYLPNFYVNIDHIENKPLVSDFVQACDLDHVNIKASTPEPGLAYIAYRAGIPGAETARHVPWELKNKRVTLGLLSSRINGFLPMVPPILLYDVPDELLQSILQRRISFLVAVDLDYVERELNANGVRARLIVDGGDVSWEVDTGNSESQIKLGHRMISNVVYGLMSLRSCIANMIAMSTSLGQLSPE